MVSSSLDKLKKIADMSTNSTIDNPFLRELYNQDTSSVYYKFLYLLVNTWEGTNSEIVELGSYMGRSTAFLSLANNAGNLTTVDIEPKPEFYKNTEKLNNVAFFKGRSDSKELLNQFEYESVDLCFFDTDHSYEVVSGEYKVWLSKIKPGGILLFDDIFMNDGMKKFWEGIELEKGYSKELHWTGFGYAIK